VSYLFIGPNDRPAARRQILFEDNHLLAIAKQAGDLVQGDRTGDLCLAVAAKACLAQSRGRPDAFIGVVHRLDRPVSGVLLLAKTSKAAARLSEQFRERAITKIYWAIVDGRLPPGQSGRLENHLWKDEKNGMARIVNPEHADSRLAALAWRILAARPGRALMEIDLLTGVFHQIRAQLAHIGCPIAGDVLYGAREGLGRMIALHALRLTFLHPIRQEPVTVTAPLPPPLLSLQRRMGLAQNQNPRHKK
jgi:23S rRNA pseudouridine1911/1915/1917 synthase